MYEQGSFEPVARVVQLASHIEQKRLADIAYETRRFVRIGESEETINQRIQDKSQPLINIYHYHCNHLGTPQELTNQDGDVIWLSYDRAWGGSFDTIYKQQFVDNFALNEFELQPIKFQGQSLDTETGLHYNRFRYYDSDVGMFISRDPIGLLGGNNVFQYAPNPIGWIDPWGLSQTYWLDKALANAARPVGSGQTAHHIVKFSSNQNEYSKASKGILDRAGIDIDSASNGARLWGTAASQKSVSSHPGKGAYNYHGGNVHTPYSDYRVMRLLERAEKSGKPDAVKNMLEAIGRKMEDGKWRTPKVNGKYKKPPSLKNPCNGP